MGDYVFYAGKDGKKFHGIQELAGRYRPVEECVAGLKKNRELFANVQLVFLDRSKIKRILAVEKIGYS